MEAEKLADQEARRLLSAERADARAREKEDRASAREAARQATAAAAEAARWRSGEAALGRQPLFQRYIRGGLTPKAAAGRAGIAWRDASRWLRAGDEFADQCAQAQASALGMLEERVIAEAQEDGKLALAVLGRRDPDWREGLNIRYEADDVAALLAGLAPDVLTELAAAAAALRALDAVRALVWSIDSGAVLPDDVRERLAAIVADAESLADVPGSRLALGPGDAEGVVVR